MTGISGKPIDTGVKRLVLETIYGIFESWFSQAVFACRKGCAACCTQDVTMTAIEGSIIIDYIASQDRLSWLAGKLAAGLPEQHPVCTTNEYARACLSGEDLDPGSGRYDRLCPFLEEKTCTIYQVRPFSCRVFASQQPCHKGDGAAVPDYYLSAATAFGQIIEHLDQNQPWGNMLHLLALATGTGQSQHLHYLTSRPLPGFLIGEEDYPRVAPLIERLFNTELDGKPLEAILNGR